MVVFPAAKDAPSLCASRFAGALNGVMASATPTGARWVSAVVPTPRAQPATGSTSPPICRASAAQTANVSATRSSSPPPSLTGLPSSSASSRAIWSRRSRASAAAPSRTSARVAGASRAISFAAVTAYAIAAWTASGPVRTAALTVRRAYGPRRSATGPPVTQSPASRAGAWTGPFAAGAVNRASSTLNAPWSAWRYDRTVLWMSRNLRTTPASGNRPGWNVTSP